jgi:hypothetical protein
MIIMLGLSFAPNAGGIRKSGINKTFAKTIKICDFFITKPPVDCGVKV